MINCLNCRWLKCSGSKLFASFPCFVLIIRFCLLSQMRFFCGLLTNRTNFWRRTWRVFDEYSTYQKTFAASKAVYIANKNMRRNVSSNSKNAGIIPTWRQQKYVVTSASLFLSSPVAAFARRQVACDDKWHKIHCVRNSERVLLFSF